MKINLFSKERTKMVDLKSFRNDLQSALKRLANAETALSAAQAALTRGEARHQLLRAELEAALVEDLEANRRLAAEFTSAEGVPDIAAAATKSGDLQSQIDRIEGALVVLRQGVADAESARADAIAARDGAVSALQAAFVEFEIARGFEMLADLRDIVFTVSEAQKLGVRAANVSEFLEAAAQNGNSRLPGAVSANALLRAWRSALEANAGAEPDPSAGAALEKVEADRQAEAEAKWQADEAEFRRIGAEEQRAAQERRAKREAEFAKGHSPWRDQISAAYADRI